MQKINIDDAIKYIKKCNYYIDKKINYYRIEYDVYFLCKYLNAIANNNVKLTKKYNLLMGNILMKSYPMDNMSNIKNFINITLDTKNIEILENYTKLYYNYSIIEFMKQQNLFVKNININNIFDKTYVLCLKRNKFRQMHTEKILKKKI